MVCLMAVTRTRGIRLQALFFTSMSEEKESTVGAIWGCLWTLIGYALFLYIEFGGIYHCFKSHKDSKWLSVVVPPVAWYYAIEWPFWHESKELDPNKVYFTDRNGVVSEITNEDKIHYLKSFALFQMANEALEANKVEESIQKAIEGVSEGRKVGHDFLKRIHPEMPKMYLEKYITGFDLSYSGLQLDEDNPNASNFIMEGQRLQNDWALWAAEHKAELYFARA